MSAVVVAGLRYVGLPLAMRAVAAGHDVTGYDTDLVRVEAEATVLAGGSCLLELASKIICEVAARNFAVVRDTLNRHGYVLYDGDRPSAERVPVADAQWTTLAVRESVRSALLPTLAVASARLDWHHRPNRKLH